MALITPAIFKLLLPLACQWAEAQETIILREGVPLANSLLEDAGKIGVTQPQQVRLRVVNEMPLPDNPMLRRVAEKAGMLSPFTVGLTLRYGIYIRADHWGDRRLVIHELAHTAQYERMGSFSAFLSAYLDECLKLGYPNGPLEQEARAMEERILGNC